MVQDGRSGLSRRAFLGFSFATAVTWSVAEAAPAVAGLVDGSSAPKLFAVRAGRRPETVFPCSVASGDPQPRGVVLWTRLDPAALPGGGGQIQVAYEIAEDEGFTRTVVRGVALTQAGRDWTVKVQVAHEALAPFSTYHYRFIVDGTASRTGRFKTRPAAGDRPERVRFGYISCQDYTNGHYTALAALAEEELDFVVHLGDYIYETTADAAFQLGQVRRLRLPGGGTRAVTLDDYRFLYRAYKADRNLQRVHERFAVIQIWDDHEFANDAYGVHHSDTDDEAANRAPERRLAANQAWAEYTAAGPAFDAAGGPIDSLRIYRSFAFGDLVDLVLTDERLYRDGPPCGLGTFDKYLTRGCPARLDPARTMLGAEQRDWFVERVTGSNAVWKVWANQVMLMQLELSNAWVRRLFPQLPQLDLYLNLDQWDGYPAERQRVLGAIREAGVRNFVTITGDLHSFGAGHLKADFDDPASPNLGVCVLGGSVTSSNVVETATFGLGGILVPPATEFTAALVGSNPHLRYFNSATHGYVVMDVDRERISATLTSVGTIRLPWSWTSTLRRFEIPRDEPRLLTPSGTAALTAAAR
jgi:alkaline phosphatase D